MPDCNRGSNENQKGCFARPGLLDLSNYLALRRFTRSANIITNAAKIRYFELPDLKNVSTREYAVENPVAIELSTPYSTSV